MLVLVLIVLSSLVALSAGLAYRTRIELRFAQATARRTQALCLARGGIERVKVLLSQHKLSPEIIAAMCRFSGTADEEQLLEQVDPATAGHLHLEYALSDEQSRFNVNTSDPAAWVNMPGITSEYVSTVLDWIDPDDAEGPNGAETSFYERLETPYVAKNRPCVTLRELLFIKGVAPSFYVGESMSRRRAADGSDRRQQTAGDSGNEEAPGLVGVFTVYGDGKINVNTASPEIMMALPGLAEEAVTSLFKFRAGTDGRLGTEDDVAITSVQSLSQVDGLSALQVDLLSQYSCFQSEFFRILAYADAGGGHACCLMAGVRVSSGRASLLSVERLF